MFPECVTCLVKQAEYYLKNLCQDEKLIDEITLDLIRDMASAEQHLKKAPILPVFLHDALESRCENQSKIKKDKSLQNTRMLQLINEYRSDISRSINPLQRALQYSLAGNRIFSGETESSNLLESMASGSRMVPVIDDSGKMLNRVRNAQTILFIGNNSGEIVADLLFLEQLNHPDIHYVVRDYQVLNEVTMEDVEEVGMNAVADTATMPSGFLIPDQMHKQSAFYELYLKADLIIAKGHNNFWKFQEEKTKDVFFLLSSQCQVISELLKIENNSTVVLYNKDFAKKHNRMNVEETLCG